MTAETSLAACDFTAELSTYVQIVDDVDERNISGPHVKRGQTAAWIKTPLGTEVGLGPGDNVLDGDPVLLWKRAKQSPISAHIYGGQTAGCIRIPLGTEVDRRPRDRKRSFPPTERGQQPPLFGPSIVAKRSPISATAELLLISIHRVK